MNLSQVKEKLSSNESLIFDLMSNPSELSEWIVWVRESSGGSYLLLNDNESVVGSSDANKILSILKDIGAKNVQVSL